MLPASGIAATSDPAILCFHHCDVKVFCFALPSICPKCSSQLVIGGGSGGDVGGAATSAPGPLLPFRLPFPFVRSSQHPCSIVLRPTSGDFLNDYNNTTDLHIAVTTSRACIVEFDRTGLERRRTPNDAEWLQCLLVAGVPEPWYELWDSVLLKTSSQPGRWTVEQYDEDQHNCYTFVLAFLIGLGCGQLSGAAHSKTDFCEKYIVPKTTAAGKYISLYRKLRAVGVYVHHDKQEPQPDESEPNIRPNTLRTIEE